MDHTWWKWLRDDIKAKFKKSGNDSHTPWYCIDTVFTITNAIDIILNQGRD